ncbi:unnamed protein product [Arctogadus glacialis]
MHADRVASQDPPQKDKGGLHAALGPVAGSGPCPSSPAWIHAVGERTRQLEDWLHGAHRSLGPLHSVAAETHTGTSIAMETSVKQQLLTCQEMLQEIEQKVTSMSDSSSGPQNLNLKQDQGVRRGLVSAGSDQESAELLASKLELLKTNLVSFQHLLEDRQGEERMTPALQDLGGRGVARLQRSASIQEMFSSPKNKLLRQSSVQQQKELEQELSEQRGLTRAIARQHSRGRLHGQDPEEPGSPSPRRTSVQSAVVGVEEEEEVGRRSWDLLQTQLLALEEEVVRRPEEGADSSLRVGAGGGVRAPQLLKDLQDLSARLRTLGASAAVRQGDPAGGANQQLVEGACDALYGASLSLSSVNTLLRSPPVMTRTEGAELQLGQLQVTRLF